MRKIIAAKTHTLLSLSNDEVVALANALNEVLHNSDVSAENCGARIGVEFGELQRIHEEIAAIVDLAGTDSFEIFEAEKDGCSLQLRAISALGAPADLSYDGAVQKIQELEDTSGGI